MLQLVNNQLSVIFPDSSKNFRCMTPGVIYAKVGVIPKNIPTFLALTEGGKSSQLTKLQAIRLIELFEDIHSIYQNLNQITASTRKKLLENEKLFLSAYSEMKITGKQSINLPDICNFDIRLNNTKNDDLLKSYGFFSLIRHLELGSEFPIKLEAKIKEPHSYKAVVDSAGLKELEELLLTSELCAIDTESDDKNPHHATLFGVSFSFKKGESFYVPLIENDLKNITQKKVLSFLKKIFKANIKYIGHNVKYDYLILRRNGVKITNIHFDTMLAANECYGDWTFFNLKYLSQRLLGKEIKSYKEIVGIKQSFLELPFKKIVEHGCEDADMTYQLYHILHKELEKKAILDQYFKVSLPLVQKLGDLEFNGISVDPDSLGEVRKRAFSIALDLKKEIYSKTGTEFNIDIQKDLIALFNEKLKLQEYARYKTINLSVLEQLAINNPIPKLIAKYKRLQKQINAIDLIIKAMKKNKIHPLFSQTRSSNGLPTSSKPNLFSIQGFATLINCFDKTIQPFFPDRRKALDQLEKIIQTPNLKRDLLKDMNILLKPYQPENEIEEEDMLLAIILGYSNIKLSRQFLIDQSIISFIRNSIELRHSRLFDWIDSFQRQAAKDGYFMVGNRKKYFDGLKSSNIEKRNKAKIIAVRWLIQY